MRKDGLSGCHLLHVQYNFIIYVVDSCGGKSILGQFFYLTKTLSSLIICYQQGGTRAAYGCTRWWCWWSTVRLARLFSRVKWRMCLVLRIWHRWQWSEAASVSIILPILLYGRWRTARSKTARQTTNEECTHHHYYYALLPLLYGLHTTNTICSNLHLHYGYIKYISMFHVYKLCYGIVWWFVR